MVKTDVYFRCWRTISDLEKLSHTGHWNGLLAPLLSTASCFGAAGSTSMTLCIMDELFHGLNTVLRFITRFLFLSFFFRINTWRTPRRPPVCLTRRPTCPGWWRPCPVPWGSWPLAGSGSGGRCWGEGGVGEMTDHWTLLAGHVGVLPMLDVGEDGGACVGHHHRHRVGLKHIQLIKVSLNLC